MNTFTHLFFDVGGVLLTNGWDRHCRAAAAEKFGYDHEETNKRHYAVADAFEEGRLTMEEYLDQVIFYEPRSFDRDTFRQFMRSRSTPHAGSFDILAQLRDQGRYTLCTLNNESTELNLYRIQTYRLDRFFSAFYSSSFLGSAKPGITIFQKVLWITNLNPERCFFIDDRPDNITAASSLGFRAALLPDPSQLREVLLENGVEMD